MTPTPRLAQLARSAPRFANVHIPSHKTDASAAAALTADDENNLPNESLLHALGHSTNLQHLINNGLTIAPNWLRDSGGSLLSQSVSPFDDGKCVCIDTIKSYFENQYSRPFSLRLSTPSKAVVTRHSIDVQTSPILIEDIAAVPPKSPIEKSAKSEEIDDDEADSALPQHQSLMDAMSRLRWELETELAIAALERGEHAEKATARLSLAANKHDSIEAKMALADCRRRGVGGPVDLLEAEKLYREAAEKGHPDALYNVAALKMAGKAQLVGESEQSAERIMKEAASRGSAAAHFYLGVADLRASGGRAISDKGLEHFIAAALRDVHYLEMLAGWAETKGKEEDVVAVVAPQKPPLDAESNWKLRHAVTVIRRLKTPKKMETEGEKMEPHAQET